MRLHSFWVSLILILQKSMSLCILLVRGEKNTEHDSLSLKILKSGELNPLLMKTSKLWISVSFRFVTKNPATLFLA